MPATACLPSEQALRGKSGYDGVCARCHGALLNGSDGNGPVLKGPAFLAHWDKDTLGSLYTKIRDTMPRDGAGTLTDEVKLQILAYLLEQNGFPAGKADLPGDVSALEEVGIEQRGVWDGVFTAAQADRGSKSAARCQGCHGPQLAGTDRAPALKGTAFLADWEDGSLNRLFLKVRDTMPPGNTDSLTPEVKLDGRVISAARKWISCGRERARDECGNTRRSSDHQEGRRRHRRAELRTGAGRRRCLVRDRVGYTLTNASEPADHARDDKPSGRGAQDRRSQAAWHPYVRIGERQRAG